MQQLVLKKRMSSEIRHYLVGKGGPVHHPDPCVLAGWTLVFNKVAFSDGEGYANFVPAEGDKVHGVLYCGTEETLEVLDHYEGVAHGHYERVEVEVWVQQSGNPMAEKVVATAYVAHKDATQTGLRPSRMYLDHLLKAQGLPQEYFSWLENHPTVSA